MSMSKLLEYAMESPERWEKFVNASHEIEDIKNEWWKILIAEVSRQWNALHIEKWQAESFKSHLNNTFAEILLKENNLTPQLKSLLEKGKNLPYRLKICLGEDENSINLILISLYRRSRNLSFYLVTGENISAEKLKQWEENNPEKNEKINLLLGKLHTRMPKFGDTSNAFFDDNGSIKTDLDELVWYAANRTKEFANQIVERIQKLQSPKMTAILEDIIKECAKNDITDDETP